MLTHTSILHRDRRHLRAGQAMIEMMLGVILIMLLIAGMVQFVTIASTHSAIDAKIRGDAGVVAMSPLTAWDTPDYILTWKAGPDGLFRNQNGSCFGNLDHTAEFQSYRFL